MQDRKTKQPLGAQQAEAAVKAGRETVEKAVTAGQETIEKAAKAGKDTAEKAVKAGTEAFTKGYDHYVSLTKEQLERVFPAAVEKFDDVAAFNKETVDAWLQAGDVAAKALGALSAEVIDYNRAAWEDGIAGAKALFGCKTIQEVVELQSSVTRAQFDRFVAEGAKLGEMTVKSTTEAVEPINARMTEAIDKLSKPIAA